MQDFYERCTPWD